MHIATIEEISVGQHVVIETEGEPWKVTVSRIEDGLLYFKETGNLEYAPEDPDQIVVME